MIDIAMKMALLKQFVKIMSYHEIISQIFEHLKVRYQFF